jgi:hypothetical protein
MKSYTDLNQSKKLAEILPLESADMEYLLEHWIDEKTGRHKEEYYEIPVVKADDDCPLQPITLPCWSLAALLNVIPYTIYKSDNEFYRLGIDKGYDDYAVWYNNNGFTITDLDVTSDNFVDACVDMIENLHKQKLL